MRRPLLPSIALALAACLLLSPSPRADEDAPEVPDASIVLNFLILKSTKSYSEAKVTAEKAAKALHLRLDLGGYEFNQESGLSLSEQECGESAFDFPCYVARGRGDEDKPYISVEYSSAFPEFAKGLYIVVASASRLNETRGASLLKKVKKLYPDAYLKRAKVWLGCMH
jgi:hypothetical protein